MEAGQKVVLLIDEVDKSSNNRIFLQFLGMLRNKYLSASAGDDITFLSVILAGVNDFSNIAYHEAHTAKIVFEFGEDGSTRIKEGLSPADYTCAKAAFRDYEFWISGGTLSR